MESNEVKRFKAKVNKVVHNFDSLMTFSIVIMLIVGIIIDCLVDHFIQNERITMLCTILGIAMPFIGATFLVNEHNDEEKDQNGNNERSD
jgi:uncharacterized membrane protein